MFRAWYIPQVPMAAFDYEAPTKEEATRILDAITKFSIFEYENRIKPDYSDVGGVQELVDGEWIDVEEEDEF